MGAYGNTKAGRLTRFADSLASILKVLQVPKKLGCPPHNGYHLLLYRLRQNRAIVLFNYGHQIAYGGFGRWAGETARGKRQKRPAWEVLLA